MYEILLHDWVVKFYNKLDDKNTARINRAIGIHFKKHGILTGFTGY